MLDMLYIVDESLLSDQDSDAPYVPNFSLPGQPTESKKINLGTFLTTGAATAVLLPPVSLLASAGAIGYLAYRALDKKAGDESRDADVQAITMFAQKHSMTIRKALENGYKFQPGHPITGKSYRVHPLAGYQGSKKENLYILSDAYDEILLAEREAELFKLLVDLGAQKITIQKASRDKSRSHVSGSVSGGVDKVAAVGVSAGSLDDSEREQSDGREFKLLGKPWRAGQTVDRSLFYWLPFEPSWEAIVHSREQGGCLSASLEIKKTTSFSSDKNLEVKLKAKMYNVDTKADSQQSSNEDQSYKVHVEFSTFDFSEGYERKHPLNS